MSLSDESLPALTSLEAMELPGLARLREHLAKIGLSPARLEPIVRAAGAVHPLLRRAVLHYHARKIKEPLGLAARALMFGDPIDGAELSAAFGDLAGLVRESGFVRETPHGFVSPFCVTVVDDFYLVSDDLSQGGQAVMGLAPTTIALSIAAFPRQQIGRALDLGCGAGAIALVLSKRSSVVVATDVNQRALALARFNARFNGIENIDVREGSMFEPVAEERFDLVVSQPPFVPQSKGGKSGEFMAGGERGDSLPLACLSTLPDHLVPGGRGVVFIEWGHGPKEAAPAERVKQTLAGAPVDLLVFQLPAGSGDAHAVEYAAALHPKLGPEFESEARDRREHLSRMGFETMVPTLSILRRVDDRKPRAEVFSCASFSQAPPNARRIDKLLAARDIAASMQAILAAKLRMVEGVTLREEQVGPGAAVESKLLAVLPPSAMSEPIPLTPELLRLATWVHESASAGAGIQAFVSQYGSDQAPEKLAIMVAKALLGGLLECSD
jgi:SAM-dependent methyltransferase